MLPPPPPHTHSKIHVLFRNKVLYPTAVLVEVKEICACRAQLDAEETRNKPWVGSWYIHSLVGGVCEGSVLMWA